MASPRTPSRLLRDRDFSARRKAVLPGRRPAVPPPEVARRPARRSSRAPRPGGPVSRRGRFRLRTGTPPRHAGRKNSMTGRPPAGLDAPTENGYRVLPHPTWVRGRAEQRLLEIVSAASDLSSSSLELAAAATDWGTTYSLAPTRANVIRALDLPPDAKVLEIGCGCGPITRYLGEQCAVVDAVEPMPARAAVARSRSRDLPSVEVYVGTLDDVPAVPTYDVVVVIGVLEYVGRGALDRDALPRLPAAVPRRAEGGRDTRRRHREPARGQVHHRGGRGPHQPTLRLPGGVRARVAGADLPAAHARADARRGRVLAGGSRRPSPTTSFRGPS